MLLYIIMTRTRKAGRSRSTGLIKGVAGLGAISVDDLARGTGRLVKPIPLVGRPARRVLNVTGEKASDLIDLAGSTTAKASGIITSPFRKLFGKRKRGRSRRRRHPHKGQRSRTRRGSKDFITHRGNKTYNRRGHRQYRKRKPYTRRRRRRRR